MKLYKFYKAILNYPYKLIYRVKVEGRENEPPPPYIVCGNHSSYSDPVLVTVVLKELPVWLGKKDLLKHAFMRFIYKTVGAIPIKREGLDTLALHKCIDAIKEGKTVGIFPQGTRIRNIDPSPEQAHAGLALIAGITKATVLPISIVTKKRRPSAFRRTKIIIHKPIGYEEYSAISEKPTKQEITNYIFEKVCEPFKTTEEERK
ncbi:MAG: lysophospholipid acyltransferase family protein [Eubacteriales bacterium]